MMQERVYRVSIREIQTSCGSGLLKTRAEFQQSAVDDVIDQWRKKQETCVHAEGGHFEYLL